MEKNIFMKIKYSNLNEKQKISLAKTINDEIIFQYENIYEKRKVKLNKEFLKELIENELFILLNIYYPKCVRLIDFEGFSFDGMNVAGKDFSYTNANIDPQKVHGKTLFYTNLEGIDLSDKNFDGVLIEGANLIETKANIDPQLVNKKSLYGTKLKGIRLRNKSLKDVDIRNSDLRNTGAKIIISDLQENNKKEHPLLGTKISGCKVYKGSTDTLLDNLYILSCTIRGNVTNPDTEKLNSLKRELRRKIK